MKDLIDQVLKSKDSWALKHLEKSLEMIYDSSMHVVSEAATRELGETIVIIRSLRVVINE